MDESDHVLKRRSQLSPAIQFGFTVCRRINYLLGTEWASSVSARKPKRIENEEKAGKGSEKTNLKW